MDVHETIVAKSNGEYVRKLAAYVWQIDPKWKPGKRTVVIIDPRDTQALLGPGWAVKAVMEVDSFAATLKPREDA